MHYLQILLNIFLSIGKTLILEAAAKTLAQREDTEVVFICALGGECYIKILFTFERFSYD